VQDGSSQGKDGGMMMMKSMDKDNDGFLSFAEVMSWADKAKMDERMKKMDKDNDGFLSLEESMSWVDQAKIDETMKKMMENAFTTTDSDKDGKLSVTEMDEMMKKKVEKAFNAVDSDKDGKLCLADLPSFNQEMMEPVGPVERVGPVDASLSQGRKDGGMMMMKNMDKDNDGFLSLAEVMSWVDKAVKMDEKMNNMDKDNDGLLSLEENMSLVDQEKMDETMKKMMENVFNAADSDKDGKLSVAEMDETKKKKVEKAFSTVDSDEDGKLSVADLRNFNQELMRASVS